MTEKAYSDVKVTKLPPEEHKHVKRQNKLYYIARKDEGLKDYEIAEEMGLTASKLSMLKNRWDFTQKPLAEMKKLCDYNGQKNKHKEKLEAMMPGNDEETKKDNREVAKEAFNEIVEKEDEVTEAYQEQSEELKKVLEELKQQLEEKENSIHEYGQNVEDLKRQNRKLKSIYYGDREEKEALRLKLDKAMKVNSNQESTIYEYSKHVEDTQNELIDAQIKIDKLESRKSFTINPLKREWEYVKVISYFGFGGDWLSYACRKTGKVKRFNCKSEAYQFELKQQMKGNLKKGYFFNTEEEKEHVQN